MVVANIQWIRIRPTVCRIKNCPAHQRTVHNLILLSQLLSRRTAAGIQHAMAASPATHQSSYNGMILHLQFSTVVSETV